MKKYAIFLLIFACFAATAAAYTRITDRSGGMPKWASMPVSYWVNELGLSQISNGSEFTAVHASFRTWQNIQNAEVTFNYRGATSVRTAGRDGMNIVSFADDTTPLGSSTIAATFFWFGSDVNRTPTIEETDIIFNTALQFSTSGENDKFDIQSVLTHEVGHLLGLDHSGLVSSVMVPFANPSQTDQRTLAYDDIAGVAELYPRPVFANVGQIRGTVRMNTETLFGAHVVAINSDGTPLVSTISQPDGTYVIRHLPVGAYRVYAEPLDLPVSEQHVGGGTTSWYRNLRTDFGTTYFGNVSTLSEARRIDVTAGNIIVADITALPRSSTNLNLTRPGFAPRVPRGMSGTLTIGGEDLREGLALSTSNPGLILGTPTFGGRLSSSAPTSATMSLEITASTPPGPKNIGVTRSGSTSVASGAIVVTEVAPGGLSISPTSGSADGGTSVTISGINFRNGAEVFFGGLPAGNVRVLDSGTIQANTPDSTPGAVNVQVFNTDGTAGIIRSGFTYVAPPPSITSVSPLSGSPTTQVTIQGLQFDSRTQNVEVRFNGVTARVVSATATSIQTIVPFGATTGPVTVTVFGQTATGPDFVVTSASASTNVAGRSYNFIDATAASGGSNLSFSGSAPCGIDDAVAFATLPFNFSLFKDTYLSGSRISISTNGWLSLETTYLTEFQNASLPAQTVTRPGGSTGTVPASLIAPFWDDLCLRSGGTVSTRTVGTSPDRRFVIQWSNMNILDEDGRDLGSNLTFEAVLFEGSNDVQFVYQSLTGDRSDGSSATVGAQDLKRTTALQTGFNQSIVRPAYFITYRFRDGGYAVDAPDVTPPTRPVVSDGGVSTSNRTELLGSWTATDPESGIKEYQYAIGRTMGGTDVWPYTTTTQNSVLVRGLNLEVGAIYYFSVRAVNNSGLISEVGVSDGIRIDPTFQPQIKIIPYSSHSASEFGGVALMAPTAMSVVLKALDSNGTLASGSNVRNPVTLNLAAGQQYARMLHELFGLQSFDGWIEIEASLPGLGVYTATGAWDVSHLDGAVASTLSSDFMLLHPGASAVMVNPSTRTANVTIGAQTVSIPARSRTIVPVTAEARVQSSEPLAVMERLSSSGKLALSPPAAVSGAATTLVFPHAVAGAGYTSTLRLANISSASRIINVTFAGVSAEIALHAGATTQFSIGRLLGLSGDEMRAGAVRVNQVPTPFGGSTPAIVGVLDIENASGLTIMNARAAATESSFAHIAHGNGLFTGLAIATGDQPANIVIEVYDAAGGVPRMGTLTLGSNQQVAKVLSEFIPSITTQLGGYIRIRSSQPVWTWEIYGSDAVMASAPPVN